MTKARMRKVKWVKESNKRKRDKVASRNLRKEK